MYSPISEREEKKRRNNTEGARGHKGHIKKKMSHGSQATSAKGEKHDNRQKQEGAEVMAGGTIHPDQR